VFGFLFSGELAEIEVSEDGVGESVEFFLVNLSWVLLVDLSSGGFDPGPLVSSEGVVKGSSEFLKSSLDFLVGEGSVVVGIEVLESSFGHVFGDASLSGVFHFLLGFSSELAEVEVLEDGVGE